MAKPTLVVDFDGVLHQYTSPWSGASVVMDGPVDGAMDFLKEALEYFHVAIFSSRSKEVSGVNAMRDALSRWGLDKQTLAELDFPQLKPAAFLTIDDRAFLFTGTFPEPATLLAFKPWNKR